MTYLAIKQIAPEQIPVIDIAPQFTADPDYAAVGSALCATAEGSGFFLVEVETPLCEMFHSDDYIQARCARSVACRQQL